jgi:FdhD protein
MDVTARNAQGFITAMDVTIPDNLLQPGIAQQRNLLSVSSCGMCGKYEIDLQLHGIVTKEVQLSATVIPAMFTEMAALQKIFAHTGGCHAASLCGQSGELLVCCEDIGRHNAVDKVIGSLLLSDRLDEAYCLLVSGRVSYEIVSKAHKANIPILCAVSAPSDMAVDCCRSCGITLLAFCRGSQYTIYTNSHRIRID